MLSMHTCPLAMLGGKKTGGMNVYVRELTRALGENGIRVDVFTRSQDNCQPMVNHDLGFGNRVIHIPAGPENPLPVMEVANYVEEFATGIDAFVKRENLQYDLIHSHYWLSGLTAERLTELWSHAVPVVQMFHTLGHMKNRIATDETQLVAPRRIIGETHVIENVVQGLVAPTEAEMWQLINLYGAQRDTISIVSPGVDLARFVPVDKAEAKTKIGVDCGQNLILFAGRIERLKGIDTLIRAMSVLEAWHPETVQDTCVVIVGGDPWNDDPDSEMYRLRQISDDLGLDNHVAFVGAKDQMLLPQYYAAADMIVMPSHYESFGMVALEAMAMGRPVIASEVGGLAHLVKHDYNGLHVPSRDPEALAASIHELLSREDYREQLGQQARQYALEYSWNNIAARIIEVYERALQTVCV